MKSKREKILEYELKYQGIPKNYRERLCYLYDKLQIDDAKSIDIINARNAYINSTYFETIKIVLYEIPEHTPRPRARLINKKGIFNAITGGNGFIQIYSITGRENKEYMRMITKEQLPHLNQLLCTPCDIEYDCYFPTPSGYNKTDIFLAEIGVIRPLIKPDFDNIEKAYSDEFTGNVWIDDIIVVDATLRKFYSILPRVEINLKYSNQVANYVQYKSITNRKDFTEGMVLNYFGGK